MNIEQQLKKHRDKIRELEVQFQNELNFKNLPKEKNFKKFFLRVTVNEKDGRWFEFTYTTRSELLNFIKMHL
jgi:hypothetical protein